MRQVPSAAGVALGGNHAQRLVEGLHELDLGAGVDAKGAVEYLGGGRGVRGGLGGGKSPCFALPHTAQTETRRAVPTALCLTKAVNSESRASPPSPFRLAPFFFPPTPFPSFRPPPPSTLPSALTLAKAVNSESTATPAGSPRRCRVRVYSRGHTLTASHRGVMTST